MAIAPLGFVKAEARLRRIGVGYVADAEGPAALQTAAVLAESARALLIVMSAFDYVALQVKLSGGGTAAGGMPGYDQEGYDRVTNAIRSRTREELDAIEEALPPGLEHELRLAEGEPAHVLTAAWRSWISSSWDPAATDHCAAS